MAHSYTLHQQSREKVIDLLRLAEREAAEGAEHSRRSRVVSPTPANAIVLHKAIQLALNIAVGDHEGTSFGPEHLTPPEPSFKEYFSHKFQEA